MKHYFEVHCNVCMLEALTAYFKNCNIEIRANDFERGLYHLVLFIEPVLPGDAIDEHGLASFIDHLHDLIDDNGLHDSVDGKIHSYGFRFDENKEGNYFYKHKGLWYYANTHKPYMEFELDGKTLRKYLGSY